MGLVNGQLNGPCLIDCEIVTGSIEVGGGAVFPPLFYCPGMTLNSPPCFVVWFYCSFFSFIFFSCLNQLSTERKSRFSRRCPDAGVGLGFGVGVFGLSGGSSLAEVLYGTYD